MGELRLVVVGDELVTGAGDPKALGWVGRVTARTRTDDRLTVVPLAVPGETTTGLGQRWEDEVARRLAQTRTAPLTMAVKRKMA